MTGSNECSFCGSEFTDDNPCWNSVASYDDNTHDDGECRQCADRREGRTKDIETWVYDGANYVRQ